MPPYAPMNTPDCDEFDEPGDGIDWAQIPDELWSNSQPPAFPLPAASTEPEVPSLYPNPPLSNTVPPTTRTRANSSSSSSSGSESFFTDSDPMDEAFLTQLDILEQQLLNETPLSCAPNLRDPIMPLSPTAIPAPQSTPAPVKRTLSSNSHVDAPSKKKQAVTDAVASVPNGSDNTSLTSSEIAKAYEDELNCPICYDIYVAPHSTNSCGHALCGPCGYEWTATLKQSRCPVCRTQLSRTCPIIPNVAMDSIVEKYVQMLSMNDRQWRPGGKEYADRITRKNKWKREAPVRERAKISNTPRFLVDDLPSGIAPSAGRASHGTPFVSSRGRETRDLVRHFRVINVDLTDSDDNDDGTFEVVEDEDYVSSVYIRA